MRKKAGLVFCLSMFTSCAVFRVETYQPLTPLRNLALVQIANPNLTGQTVLLECIKSSYFGKDSQRRLLCSRLRAAFEKQGATVLDVEDGKTEDTELNPDQQKALPAGYLKLRVHSKLLQDKPNYWMLIPMVATVSLIPWTGEHSFAIQSELYNSGGTLLATDYFAARILTYTGPLYVALNGAFNLTLRSKDEKVSLSLTREGISSDIYLRLSQFLYNAKTSQDIQTVRKVSDEGEEE
jgi:hypothetical protein